MLGVVTCFSGIRRSMRPQVVIKSAWQSSIVLLTILAQAAIAVQFNVYEPCQGVAETAASVPQCRREPGISAAKQAIAVSAVPQQLPIDMRLPCNESDVECDQNVDVTRVPQPPTGLDISSCSHELMPWSPFPCTYNTRVSRGIPGQPTNLCYKSLKPSNANLAVNLTTDGYQNLYFGSMPDQLCSQSNKAVKMLLTLDFRLAAGRQFDRIYSFQIGRAVVALGTCSEPSRLIKADKYWTVTVDVSYLQAYLQPGLPTRFSLGNVLSNTYNVPIWAKATLAIYYQTEAPSRTLLPESAISAGVEAVAAARTSFKSQHSHFSPNMTEISRTNMSFSTHNVTGVLVTPGGVLSDLPADVPTEVIPLTIANNDYESLVSVSGNGDSPVSWPNVTFQLPASLSEGGTVYRAQLKVVPKGNACEEFWALNPPGAQTNSSCDGVSTGDPYREVRVYVDGQLAGVYPIYYTMYTGGVDPRLWTAIVASHAYSLPVYTFDLGPWLGRLNTPMGSGPTPDQSHKITVEIFGATGADWILATTLLIWRSSDLTQIVTAVGEPWTSAPPDVKWGEISKCDGENLTDSGTCVTEVRSRTFTAETSLKVGNAIWNSVVLYHLSHYSDVITYNNTEATSTWNQRTRHTAVWYTGLTDPTTSSAQTASRKRQPQARHKFNSSDVSITRSQDPRRAQRRTGRSADLMRNGIRGARLWNGTGLASVDGKYVITQNFRQYDWVNVGGQYEMAPYVFSFNETLLAPTLYTSIDRLGSSDGVVISGRQRHYQRALMVNVYNTSSPACTVPKEPTHTAVLWSSINAASCGDSDDSASANSVCESWDASCAFCAPSLSKNEYVVQPCQISSPTNQHA